MAGERLVDGEYVDIGIEELPDGNLQGYSSALNLNLRWEHGELRFCDPATGRPIATLAEERTRADAEREARTAAEAQANVAREARTAAEVRVRELEELLRHQNP